MWTRRRAVLIIMVIILAGGGEKSYKGVLTITEALIRVECDKKIFQPFNEFDAPGKHG